MKSPVRAAFVLLASLALTASLATACGSDSAKEPTAVESACKAWDDLTSAVRTAVDDVQAGNLDKARSSLPAVTSALSDFSAAISKLGSDERAKLQPQVDDLTTQLQQVGDASTMAEVRAAITQAGSASTQLATTIRNDLQCPSD